MATLLTPGVYAHTAHVEAYESLKYGIAGFVGVAQRGPEDAPQFVDNWKEFQEIFGDFLPCGHLAYAVHGFFDNDGKGCYVLRTADDSAKAAERHLYSDSGRDAITIRALNRGQWGNDISVTIGPGSSDTLFLTVLKEIAQKDNDEILVDSLADFGRQSAFTLVSASNPEQKQLVSMSEFTEGGALRLASDNELLFNFPKGSRVYGRGVKLTVRYRQTEEIFDNLSLNPNHFRFFKWIINGPKQETQYLSKAANGNSILVRAQFTDLPPGKEAVRKGNDLYFLREDQRVTRARLKGGTNGDKHASLALRDHEMRDTIQITSKAEGKTGNHISVEVSNPCKSSLAKSALAGDGILVLKDSLDLITDDRIEVVAGSQRDELVVKTTAEEPHDNRLRALEPIWHPFAAGSIVKGFVTTRLEKTAPTGSTELFVQSVVNFMVGQRVVISDAHVANRSFEFDVEETRGGQSVSTIVAHAPLPYEFSENSQITGPASTELSEAVELGSRELAVATAENWTTGKCAVIISKDEPVLRNEFTIVEISSTSSLQKVILKQPIPRDYNVGARVETNGFTLTVTHGVFKESYTNLSMDPLDDYHYFESRVRAHSRLISADPVQKGSPLSPLTMEDTHLTGGRDLSEIDWAHYTGYDRFGDYFLPNGEKKDPTIEGNSGRPRVGLAMFEEVSEIDIVAIPDLQFAIDDDAREGSQSQRRIYQQAQKQMLRHCDNIGYRFAILDLPPLTGLDEVTEWPRHFAFLDEQKFGAVYHPWLEVRPLDDGGQIRWVPPSGHIAGVYSRTDLDRGIAQAPANTAVKGVFRLKSNISTQQQARFNPVGVNSIRRFPNRGILVWGARTLSKEKQWRYVNTTRLYLALVKAILLHLNWITFESNVPDLWRRITDTLTSLIEGFFLKGFLQGMEPREAFFVKCDEETNPPEVVERGQVVTKVGLALVAPAEFIVITVRRNVGRISISEA